MTTAHDALKAMFSAYGRLHDMLSDCIESGRLSEADLPDDYKALADQLAGPCNDADNLARSVLEPTTNEQHKEQT